MRILLSFLCRYIGLFIFVLTGYPPLYVEARLLCWVKLLQVKFQLYVIYYKSYSVYEIMSFETYMMLLNKWSIDNMRTLITPYKFFGRYSVTNPWLQIMNFDDNDLGVMYTDGFALDDIIKYEQLKLDDLIDKDSLVTAIYQSKTRSYLAQLRQMLVHFNKLSVNDCNKPIWKPVALLQYSIDELLYEYSLRRAYLRKRLNLNFIAEIKYGMQKLYKDPEYIASTKLNKIMLGKQCRAIIRHNITKNIPLLGSINEKEQFNASFLEALDVLKQLDSGHSIPRWEIVNRMVTHIENSWPNMVTYYSTVGQLVKRFLQTITLYIAFYSLFDYDFYLRIWKAVYRIPVLAERHWSFWKDHKEVYLDGDYGFPYQQGKELVYDKGKFDAVQLDTWELDKIHIIYDSSIKIWWIKFIELWKTGFFSLYNVFLEGIIQYIDIILHDYKVYAFDEKLKEHIPKFFYNMIPDYAEYFNLENFSHSYEEHLHVYVSNHFYSSIIQEVEQIGVWDNEQYGDFIWVPDPVGEFSMWHDILCTRVLEDNITVEYSLYPPSMLFYLFFLVPFVICCIMSRTYRFFVYEYCLELFGFSFLIIYHMVYMHWIGVRFATHHLYLDDVETSRFEDDFDRADLWADEEDDESGAEVDWELFITMLQDLPELRLKLLVKYWTKYFEIDGPTLPHDTFIDVCDTFYMAPKEVAPLLFGTFIVLSVIMVWPLIKELEIWEYLKWLNEKQLTIIDVTFREYELRLCEPEAKKYLEETRDILLDELPYLEDFHENDNENDPYVFDPLVVERIETLEYEEECDLLGEYDSPFEEAVNLDQDILRSGKEPYKKDELKANPFYYMESPKFENERRLSGLSMKFEEITEADLLTVFLHQTRFKFLKEEQIPEHLKDRKRVLRAVHSVMYGGRDLGEVEFELALIYKDNFSIKEDIRGDLANKFQSKLYLSVVEKLKTRSGLPESFIKKYVNTNELNTALLKLVDKVIKENNNSKKREEFIKEAMRVNILWYIVLFIPAIPMMKLIKEVAILLYNLIFWG